MISMQNKKQKLDLPFDTALFPNGSAANIVEWRDKLGIYK